MRIQIPHNWKPRSYQQNLWNYFENGGRYAAVAWHRRAGKDDVLLRLASTWVVDDPATYWHMLPEYAQARKAIWDAVNPHTGKRRIDEAFPVELRETTREQDMLIRFKTGATWQLVGSDSYDKLVGSPPKGVVASEWALANPSAWAYIRPILAENGGRAAFISTFRGRNHFHAMVDRAVDDPNWFGEILSAESTDVFTPEQLARERAEYVAEYGEDEGDALYRQEYLSDPSASIQGAFYGIEVARAAEQGRIGVVPYDPGKLVYTGWDLGYNDPTAIWYMQIVGMEPRLIDYTINRQMKITDFASEVRSKPYNYGGHFLPHDGDSKSGQTGLTYKEILQNAGLQNVDIVLRASNTEAVVRDINTARRLIEMARFDETRCARGLDALRNYRREWDDRLKKYRKRPLHDWASDGADAFRALAVAWESGHMDMRPQRRPRKREATSWMSM